MKGIVPDLGEIIKTTDSAYFLRQLGKIYVHGGGDCQEPSLSGWSNVSFLYSELLISVALLSNLNSMLRNFSTSPLLLLFLCLFSIIPIHTFPFFSFLCNLWICLGLLSSHPFLLLHCFPSSARISSFHLRFLFLLPCNSIFPIRSFFNLSASQCNVHCTASDALSFPCLLDNWLSEWANGLSNPTALDRVTRNLKISNEKHNAERSVNEDIVFLSARSRFSCETSHFFLCCILVLWLGK